MTVFDSLTPGVLQRFSYLVRLSYVVVALPPMGFATPRELRELR